jgi:hypothetical protein
MVQTADIKNDGSYCHFQENRMKVRKTLQKGKQILLNFARICFIWYHGGQAY